MTWYRLEYFYHISLKTHKNCKHNIINLHAVWITEILWSTEFCNQEAITTVSWWKKIMTSNSPLLWTSSKGVNINTRKWGCLQSMYWPVRQNILYPSLNHLYIYNFAKYFLLKDTTFLFYDIFSYLYNVDSSKLLDTFFSKIIIKWMQTKVVQYYYKQSKVIGTYPVTEYTTHTPRNMSIYFK